MASDIDVHMSMSVGVTPALRRSLECIDSVLPKGESTEDMFKAFGQDVGDLIQYLNSFAEVDLVGQKIVIEFDVKKSGGIGLNKTLKELLKSVKDGLAKEAQE